MPKYTITEQRVSIEIWNVEASTKQEAYDLLKAEKLGTPDRTDGHSYAIDIERLTEDGEYDFSDREIFVEEGDEEEDDDGL